MKPENLTSKSADIDLQPCKSANQYRELVERYSFLVDAELQLLETSDDPQQIAKRLPKIISAVNVIGYLRGQDGMFVGSRPPLDFQSELYRNEAVFEKRLSALIEKVKQSPFIEEYTQQLTSYYVGFRG